MLAGCRGWQSATDPQGPQASQLDALIWLFVIVAGVIWALVMLVLAAALWRRRRLAEPRERRTAWFVGGAMAASVLVILGLTVASYVTTRHISPEPADPLVIRLKGYQWWWSATYAAARPADSFTTANELHVPVGRPVRVELEAEDVIHSFWVPNLAGKQDLIPGRSNSLVFTVDRPGTYRGQCAEFCGLQHAHMALLVVAESEDDFQRWRTAQLADAKAPATPEQSAGRDVFVAKSLRRLPHGARNIGGRQSRSRSHPCRRTPVYRRRHCCPPHAARSRPGLPIHRRSSPATTCRSCHWSHAS